MNGGAGYMSDEEADTRVAFGGGSVSKRDDKKWSRLELLLAALCVLLATVCVVLVVIVAAQNIHKDHDSANRILHDQYGSSQGAGQEGQGAGWTGGRGHGYTVLPDGAGHGSAPSQTGHAHQQTPPQEDVCLTEGCVKAASQLLTAMDQSVDPCEDFFQFACGSWNTLNVIPDDMAHFNTFAKLGDEIQVILKDLLETPIHEGDLEAVKKSKKLYSSCVNETAIDLQGLNPLLSLVKELGGWPVLEGPQWSGQGLDLVDLLVKLRLYNVHVLLEVNVGPDERQSGVHIIQMDQPDLGMPSRDYYLKEEDASVFVGVYERYAHKVAAMLGAQGPDTLQQIQDLVQLEIKLANITVPKAERRDIEKLYNKITVKQLQQDIPGFDWLKFLQDVFQSVNMDIKQEEEVVVYSPEYLKKMVDILKTTDKRTIVNYVMWRIVMDHVSDLPKQHRAVKKDYHKAIYGAKKERSRWRDCVKYVTRLDVMGDVVGRVFVEKHFDETSKSTAVEMIHNIRGAFYDLIEEADWMDEQTRVVAREKARVVGEQVGYDDSILDDSALNQKYAQVQFSTDHYFDNMMANVKRIATINLKKLRDPVDRSQWLTTPTVVNAYYISTRNLMTIPAAILQPPFYNKEYPKSLNYGGIGMVIGHEITHGFDDRGRQYDKHGNLIQWWDNEVIQRFKDRAQCMIDQYSNFTLVEVNTKLNGIQTQGENIADNGGIKEAYRAYRKWVKERGKEEAKLPGMQHYTQDQLFFINFAQVWCGSMRPEAMVNKVRTGAHSPGRFRVIGTLQNQDFFSKAFNCSPSSYMNPPKKCSIW